jgi:group I intron endonuclease
MNRFYVYALLDTSKPGIYMYDDLIFDYEPFYIGKGTDNRDYHSAFDRHNSFKKNKIQSLKKKNIKVFSIKVSENLNEKDSFDLEISLIKKIGRRDLKLGPLTNLTDGGDGRTNIIVSEETKRKISESKKSQNLHNKHTESTKTLLKKINQGENNPFYGKNHTEEVKEEHSIRISGANHPMWGKKHNEETLKKIRTRRNENVDQQKLVQLSKELNSKSVIQMTLDGHFIAEFSSIKEASIQTGCSESIIGKCCRGVIKKPRKFIFEFKNSESFELKNSFEIKIGDKFLVNGLEYKLVKRNKQSVVGEIEKQLFTFRKKDYPELFKKRLLELHHL